MADVSSICVFCGSSAGLDPRHLELARAFGAAIGRRGLRLVYGGGRIGLMGALADAALAAGADVVGVIPEHLMAREVGHGRLGALEVVDGMHARKARMFALADAFTVLPGGPGTLDEAFEILTWRQLALHDKPVVLLDPHDYWRPLLALLAHIVEAGFARDGLFALYAVARSVEEAFALLAAAPPPAIPPRPERL